MTTDSRHPADDHLVTPDVRHERRDVSLRAIVGFGVAMIVIAALLHVLLWWMFRLWNDREEAFKRRAYGQPPSFVQRQESAEQLWYRKPATTRQRLPTEPLLEGLQDPARLRKWRDADESRAAAFGWVDRKAQIVHVPVDVAIDLLAQRGARAAPKDRDAPPPRRPAVPAAGLSGESNSGRRLGEETP